MQSIALMADLEKSTQIVLSIESPYYTEGLLKVSIINRIFFLMSEHLMSLHHSNFMTQINFTATIGYLQ